MGGCQISLKKRYEDVRFNVISITRGWVGVEFPEKKLNVFQKFWTLSFSHLYLLLTYVYYLDMYGLGALQSES